MAADEGIEKSLDTEELNQDEMNANNQADLNIAGEQRLVDPRLNISDLSIVEMGIEDGFKDDFNIANVRNSGIAKSSKFEGR